MALLVSEQSALNKSSLASVAAPAHEMLVDRHAHGRVCGPVLRRTLETARESDRGQGRYRQKSASTRQTQPLELGRLRHRAYFAALLLGDAPCERNAVRREGRPSHAASSRVSRESMALPVSERRASLALRRLSESRALERAAQRRCCPAAALLPMSTAIPR